MTTPADIAAAVLAEREACARECAAYIADRQRECEYMVPSNGLLFTARDMIRGADACASRIRSRPAPDTAALERALRACARRARSDGHEAGLLDARGPGSPHDYDAAIQAAIAAGRGAM